MNRILSVVPWLRSALCVTVAGVLGVPGARHASADDVYQPDVAVREFGPVDHQETRHMMAVVEAPNDSDYAGAYVVGQKQFGLGTSQITTTRILPDGTIAWVRAWPEFPEGKCYGVAVVADGNGYVWVAGAYTAGEGARLDMVVLKYDYTGCIDPTCGSPDCDVAVCFPVTWSGCGDGDDYPVAMTLDGATGLWIVGVANNPLYCPPPQVPQVTGIDYVLWGVDQTTGAQLGVDTWDHAGLTDQAVDIGALPVGAGPGGGGGTSNIIIIVTGTSVAPVTKSDIQTLGYRFNGALLRETAYDWRHTGQGANTSEIATSVAVTSNAQSTVDYAVSGFSTAWTGTQDYLVMSEYWNQPMMSRLRWDDHQNGFGEGQDQTRKILFANDRNGDTRVVVTGFAWAGSSNNYDSWTLSYRRDGVGLPRSWRSGYDFDDRATDMVATDWNPNLVPPQGGHIYILGVGQHFNGLTYEYDYRTVKLDSLLPALGSTLWDGGSVVEGSVDGALGFVAWDIGGPEIPAAIRINTSVLVGVEQQPLGVNFPDVWATGRSTAPLEGTPRYATVRYYQLP